MDEVADTSDGPSDDFLDRALDQLHDEENAGIALVAFCKTVIDRHENTAKISGSFAGHAAELQIRAVLRELRLWCCRVWDSDKDAHSLPQVAKNLGGKAEAIIAARIKDDPEWNIDGDRANKVRTQIQTLCKKVNLESDSALLMNLQLARNENFAHLLRGTSRIRTKQNFKDADKGYTWNQVFDLATNSYQLIAEAIYIWKRQRHNTQDTFNMHSRNFETYWRLLPNFAEAEENDALARTRKTEN